MTILTVRHRTTYRYASPVEFGEHRLMFRPRDSHDLRLLDTSLVISPSASVRWLHDVFGNSIAIARFEETAAELSFLSSFHAKPYPLPLQELTLEPFAERYPFSYAVDEVADLGRTAERHYPDPDHRVDLWARQLVDNDPGRSTMGILLAMTHAIRNQFHYMRRAEMGTQDPVQTLATRYGSRTIRSGGPAWWPPSRNMPSWPAPLLRTSRAGSASRPPLPPTTPTASRWPD